MSETSPRRAAREASRAEQVVKTRPARRMPTYAQLRDAILFAAGLAGIAYQTVVESGDRPTLLLLFAGMVGLPAFLRTDEKHKPAPPAIKEQQP